MQTKNRKKQISHGNIFATVATIVRTDGRNNILENTDQQHLFFSC